MFTQSIISYFLGNVLLVHAPYIVYDCYSLILTIVSSFHYMLRTTYV